ncbi:MAG: hypothetical protein ACTSPX_02725 [Candidatus Thorarchaeota archaeon]
MNVRTKILLGTAIPGLVLLLAYNFVHIGGLLAEYVRPWQVGYAAAFGIETIVVSLSLQIGMERRHGTRAGFFVGVLVAVVAVSAVANVVQGYSTKYGVELTLSNAAAIDPIQALVGTAATGLLSLVVFALAEIIGQDIGEREPVTQADSTDPVEELLRYYREHPDGNQEQAGQAVGKSRSWVSKKLRELERAGRIRRDGRGVEVLEGAKL